MTKTRKKRSKSRPQNSQPVTVHRYSAEDEDRKDSRRKLKIRGIAATIAAAIATVIGMLIF
ncbi:MAG: hypothetical protein WD467_03045 [Candidatus Saccharimonadales bacterium]